MILDRQQSCVLVVDVQQKLTPLVQNSQYLISNCQWIMRLARELDIDVLVSEHYPSGLGNSVAEILEYTNPNEVIDKVHFSCAADANCMARINALSRPQVVLVGIESHVCILQTAMDLHNMGKQVFVVEDAVSSRNINDHRLAMARMQQAGINIISMEMAFFEWMHQAGTAQFKALAKEFIQ